MPSLSASDPLARDVEAVSRLSAVPTILRTVSEVTGLRFAVIARVTPEQWVACAVHDEIAFGLAAGGTLDVSTTLCSKVRDSRVPVVINHASSDGEYCSHMTPKMYGFESYIAVPIFLLDGEYFGNVCALDPLPRAVNQPKILAVMKLFGELIAQQLAVEAQQLAAHEQATPVDKNADQLLHESLAEAQRKIVAGVRESGRYTASLVSNLIDFARDKLGGHMTLSKSQVTDLAALLEGVATEFQSAHPARTIRFKSELTASVACDPDRVCQLLSNLLANAIEHGDPKLPIDVNAVQSADTLRLSVRNQGAPVSAEARETFFAPYRRSDLQSLKGLGLGLYVANEIATAHGGTLEAQSTDAATLFTAMLPTASSVAAANL